MQNAKMPEQRGKWGKYEEEHSKHFHLHTWMQLKREWVGYYSTANLSLSL